MLAINTGYYLEDSFLLSFQKLGQLNKIEWI